MEIAELEGAVRRLRREAIEMLYRAQSGHPGSALSTMDVLVALFLGGLLRHSPSGGGGVERDYFILSNGHACPALYTVLAEAGYFRKAALGTLRQLGSGLQGHPHRGALPGIEISSGSLGQGLSVGIGLAYGLKLKRRAGQVFVMMSDGEQEEGSTWEAVMYAGKMALNNLVAIIDKNKWQIDGATVEVMSSLDPLADKYRAFGWRVQEIDGHSMEEVLAALEAARGEGGPVVIVSHTVRGKGVSFMEDSEHWHAGTISQEEYERALRDLG